MVAQQLEGAHPQDQSVDRRELNRSLIALGPGQRAIESVQEYFGSTARARTAGIFAKNGAGVLACGFRGHDR